MPAFGSGDARRAARMAYRAALPRSMSCQRSDGLGPERNNSRAVERRKATHYICWLPMSLLTNWLRHPNGTGRSLASTSNGKGGAVESPAAAQRAMRHEMLNIYDGWCADSSCACGRD